MIDFANGVKTAEVYFVKNRMVNRKRYEKARLVFPEMPASDESLVDVGAKLIELARAERRQHAEEGKVHHANPVEARKNDIFCEAMLQRGKTANADRWIQNYGNAIGEYGHKNSRKIIEKLIKLGCKQVFACEIHHYDNGQESSDNLVVELPIDAASRRQVFRALGRLAYEQGFEADFDDGQSFAYVKLD